MELTADAAKILASKLDVESLSLFMSTSNAVRDVFNTALSDDYTYKLMTEELLGTSLPEYRNHRWKDVYDFFIAKSIRPNRILRKDWSSMSSIQQRLYNALFSDDSVIVEIAILVGQDPSVRSNSALSTALIKGNSKVTKVLLNDSRVGDILEHSQIVNAFGSGDIETINLILNDPRVQTKGGERSMVLATIDSGNVETLEYVLNRLGVDRHKAINVVDLSIVSNNNSAMSGALSSENPDMILYLLNNPTIQYTEDKFIDTMMDSMPSDDILTIMFNHPRVKPMIRKNRRYILRLLIENGRDDFTEMLLEDPKLDVSRNKYEIVLTAIEEEANEILEKLLRRPEVQPDIKMSLKMLTKCYLGDTLRILMDSEKIILDEESSEAFIMHHINTENAISSTVLDNKKIIINKKITRRVFRKALDKKKKRVLKTLLTHRRTKKYYTTEDIEAVANIQVKQRK
jgi:hypothetical protein